MALSRMLARPLLASTFFLGATNALRNADAMAVKARKVTDKVVPMAQRAAPQVPIPDDATTLVRINAGVQLGAATLFALGRAPRLSAAVLAGTLVPTTLAGHRFWELDDPALRKQQQLHFAKNVSVLGGLLIAAGDTEGRPGVAWRARHAAKDARREARHLARAAKREARLHT